MTLQSVNFHFFVFEKVESWILLYLQNNRWTQNCEVAIEAGHDLTL